MKELKFEISKKDGEKIICDVMAIYHDDDTDKDFIVYTDRTKNNDGKLKIYYSLYKLIDNKIKLIDVKNIEDKKIGLQLIEELIKDIK